MLLVWAVGVGVGTCGDVIWIVFGGIGESVVGDWVCVES